MSGQEQTNQPEETKAPVDVRVSKQWTSREIEALGKIFTACLIINAGGEYQAWLTYAGHVDLVSIKIEKREDLSPYKSPLHYSETWSKTSTEDDFLNWCRENLEKLSEFY